MSQLVCSFAAYQTIWGILQVAATPLSKVRRAPVPGRGTGRLNAPAFHRNCGPILEVLRKRLGNSSGQVLELGSGTGQHVVAFASELRDLIWWPSDSAEDHVQSIEAWRRDAGLSNVRPPVQLDVRDADWGLGAEGAPPKFGVVAMLCINVLHIAPWAVAAGIMRGAQRYLEPHGQLFFYGPFMRGGLHTADSNARFDALLRSQNPEWQVRDVADLEACGARHGLALDALIEMPANNLTLVFCREGQTGP